MITIKETVKLVDGSEIEVTCRYLLPRKAYSIIRGLMRITEMKPVTVEYEEEGQKKTRESQQMIGDFSGIIELMPLAVDEIVKDCPQKKEISVESMKDLYSKYAEKTVAEVMATVNPNFK